MKSVWIIFSFLLVLAPSGAASEEGEQSLKVAFKIVVNLENEITKLSRVDLARIYLGRKTLWGSQTVVPVMLQEKNPVTQVFVEKILNRKVRQYRAYWKRRLFSGGGTMPKTFHTSTQILEFVAKTPGAIGLVDSSSGGESVRVVALTD